MVIRRRNFRRRYVRRTGRRGYRPYSKRSIRGKVKIAQGKARTSRRYRNVLRMVGTIAEKKFTITDSSQTWTAPGWRYFPWTWPEVGTGDNQRVGNSVYCRHLLSNMEFTFNPITSTDPSGSLNLLPQRIRILVVQPKGLQFSVADLPVSALEFTVPESYFVLYDKSFYVTPPVLGYNGTYTTSVSTFYNTKVWRRLKIPIMKKYVWETNTGVPTPLFPYIYILSNATNLSCSYSMRLYYTDS